MLPPVVVLEKAAPIMSPVTADGRTRDERMNTRETSPAFPLSSARSPGDRLLDTSATRFHIHSRHPPADQTRGKPRQTLPQSSSHNHMIPASPAFLVPGHGAKGNGNSRAPATRHPVFSSALCTASQGEGIQLSAVGNGVEKSRSETD